MTTGVPTTGKDRPQPELEGNADLVAHIAWRRLVDGLPSAALGVVAGIGRWAISVPVAVEPAPVPPFSERPGDRAVNVTHRLRCLVGEVPDGP